MGFGEGTIGHNEIDQDQDGGADAEGERCLRAWGGWSRTAAVIGAIHTRMCPTTAAVRCQEHQRLRRAIVVLTHRR